MKRLIILIIILTCFTALCLGQRRLRGVAQKIIQLTEPSTKGKLTFEGALNKQQNILMFNGQTLDRTLIGQLAWAAQGLREPQESFQAVQPINESSPLKVYLATHEGLFIYQPAENSMEQMISQDVRIALAAAVTPLGDSVAGAGCTFIVTAPTRRLATQRGNSRSTMYLQAGHIAQNIQLQAICLDLGSATISNFDTRGVSAACKLPRNIEPLYIICVGYPASKTTSQAGNDQTDAVLKRAALIVPSVNFRDEELFETINALRTAGVQVVVASTRIGILKGMLGGPIQSGALVNQLKVDNFDGIIFIGGTGAIEYVYDPFALNLIREAFKQRKILGATSTAPSILANAGVLNGVKVAASPSESIVLQRLGAVYMNTPVEENMKIITCIGPAAAVPFARTVTDAITGR